MKKVFLKKSQKFRGKRLYWSSPLNFEKILRNTNFAEHVQSTDYETLIKIFSVKLTGRT